MSKALREMLVVARDLALGRYPTFVYRSKSGKGEIPCFCLHGVSASPFEEMLRYLQVNGYRTLSPDELVDALLGKIEVPARSVFLSFDDGTGSMWSIAYPLLKKYGLRGTVFLIPGRINRRTRYLPNLEDLWKGQASPQELEGRDESDEPFATWEEIREMHESGAMDFESHSLDHSLIFVSPRIVDFVHPAALKGYHRFEFPRIRISPERVVDHASLGSPLYETSPRLSDRLRYLEDPAIGERCVAYVAEQGGAEFFESSDWRERLTEIVSAERAKRPSDSVYESEAAQRAAIRFELSESKRLIDENLPGKSTRHICYPWGVGGAISMQIAQEVGYQAGYWEQASKRVRPGQELGRIPRMGPDFFFLMPGAGRQSLRRVIAHKIRSRMDRSSPYLSH